MASTQQCSSLPVLSESCAGLPDLLDQVHEQELLVDEEFLVEFPKMLLMDIDKKKTIFFLLE